MNQKIRFFENLKRLKSFLSKLGLEPVHLFMPSVIALAAAIFEGISFVLLAPTVRGLIELNFQFVYSVKGIGPLIAAFPAIFLNRTSAIFIFLVTLILTAAIAKNILTYVSSVLISEQVRRLSHELRCLLFDSYIRFKKSFFDKNSAGHLQNILIGQTEQIASQFKNLHGALYGLFSLCVYFCVMLVMSWKTTLFVLLAFPILMLFFRSLVSKIKQDSQKFSDAFLLLGKKISNALACIPLVKASCTESREQSWFKHVSEKVRKSQLDMDRQTLLIEPVQEVFLLFMLMLLVGFTAYLSIRQKEGNLAIYLVFFMVLRRAMANIGAVTAVQGSIAAVLGPLREVMQVFEGCEANKEKTGILPLLKFKNKIEFKNLTFCYNDREVLKDLNFEIKKGQMVAIIGATGSGKSTIAQLLMRFYDSAPGTLMIDGQDILQYQISALRKKIAYISQENYFLDASIEINLKYGCVSDPAPEEISSALEKAQLKELIQKLPNGINTEIGERGIQLSGGEKQRLSLARAILRNPEILILDEATSAMDSQTEKLIQASITEVTKDRTSIVIAHRLTTIQKADLILVLNNSQLVEKGDFQQLINLNGYFKSYWESQKIGRDL